MWSGTLDKLEQIFRLFLAYTAMERFVLHGEARIDDLTIAEAAYVEKLEDVGSRALSGCEQTDPPLQAHRPATLPLSAMHVHQRLQRPRGRRQLALGALARGGAAFSEQRRRSLPAPRPRLDSGLDG